MTRTIAAAILAASLGLAPAAQADRLLYRLPDNAPQQTQRGGNQAAQILGGLAVLGALGYTLNKLGDDDDHDDRRHENPSLRPSSRLGWKEGGPPRGPALELPAAGSHPTWLRPGGRHQLPLPERRERQPPAP